MLGTLPSSNLTHGQRRPSKGTCRSRTGSGARVRNSRRKVSLPFSFLEDQRGNPAILEPRLSELASHVCFFFLSPSLSFTNIALCSLSSLFSVKHTPRRSLNLIRCSPRISLLAGQNGKPAHYSSVSSSLYPLPPSSLHLVRCNVVSHSFVITLLEPGHCGRRLRRSFCRCTKPCR